MRIRFNNNQRLLYIQTKLTLERERKVSELPDFAAFIVKDLVLDVVLPHVCNDQLVIDDCWSDSLFLDLLLGLKVILNALFHRLSIGHHFSKLVFLKLNIR